MKSYKVSLGATTAITAALAFWAAKNGGKSNVKPQVQTPPQETTVSQSISPVPQVSIPSVVSISIVSDKPISPEKEIILKPTPAEIEAVNRALTFLKEYTDGMLDYEIIDDLIKGLKIDYVGALEDSKSIGGLQGIVEVTYLKALTPEKFKEDQRVQPKVEQRGREKIIRALEEFGVDPNTANIQRNKRDKKLVTRQILNEIYKDVRTIMAMIQRELPDDKVATIPGGINEDLMGFIKSNEKGPLPGIKIIDRPKKEKEVAIDQPIITKNLDQPTNSPTLGN